MENNEKDILERIFEDGGVPEGASCAVNGGVCLRHWHSPWRMCLFSRGRSLMKMIPPLAAGRYFPVLTNHLSERRL
jgi:hypothetical protein